MILIIHYYTQRNQPARQRFRQTKFSMRKVSGDTASILHVPASGTYRSPLNAKDYLLREGTDMKYGARHLKRAIDRTLVQPLSNLIATGQARGGDSIYVDFNPALGCLAFYRDGEDVPADARANLTDPALPVQATEVPQGAVVELPRAAKARSGRR
jgi:hypothetical protein